MLAVLSGSAPAPRPRRGASYFLSGVMQGARASGDGFAGVVSQDYRAEIKAAVLAADGEARVIDPWELIKPLAAELYPAGTARDEMFHEAAHVQRGLALVTDAAADADVVVSYLPEASMGSALELHAARAKRRLVYVVAPGKMARNWVVVSHADRIFESIEQLAGWLRGGGAEGEGPAAGPS